jgi:hypothetical protein
MWKIWKKSFINQLVYAEKLKVETMELSSELMKNYQLASSRYKAALKEKNAFKGNNEASRKRKTAFDDIAELKRQILNLNKEIEQKSLETEEKQDLTFVAMANSFRATQNKKIEKVEVLRYHPEDGG